MLKWPAKIPSLPGIYFFKDQKGRMFYIGKASNLKKRLASYQKLPPTGADQRIKKMLETASRLSWQETGSEIEALILESRFIKKYRPPFNIMLRDDKQYFFVGITHSTGSPRPELGAKAGQAKETFPRIFLTHQPLKLADNITLSPKPMEPVPSVPPKGSPSAIESKKQLLSQFVGPFTEGSSLKSTLKLLRRIFPYCTCKQKHHRYCLNYHLGNCPGFCCLKDGLLIADRQLINLYQKNIKAVRDILKGKRISVLKDLEKEMEKSAKQSDFKKAIEARNKISQLKQVFENAKVIKELAGKENILAKMQKMLNLPSLPHRIEGYDISNIQGQFATGAMVVFTDGQPDKNEYRKFKICTGSPRKEGDAAMLKEILTRRFKHPEWPFPDLILVDGGRAQLNATRSIAPQNIPVIALTKNNRRQGHHIFLNTKKEPLALSKLPLNIRNIILYVDSEAHRFAISYYRKLHRKTI